METVSNDKEFLGEFIASLEEEQVKTETTPQVDQSNEWSDIEEVREGASGRVKAETTPQVDQSNVWSDIEEALHRWMCKILDAESRLEKTASFRENIEASLQRQQLDGLINYHDITELQYIADLWTNLLNYTSSYTIGCQFVKRDIISCLLELYNRRQINECLFIEACLKL